MGLRGRLHVRFCVRIGVQLLVRIAGNGVPQLSFMIFLLKSVETIVLDPYLACLLMEHGIVHGIVHGFVIM
jgi:hypothetical protein